MSSVPVQSAHSTPLETGQAPPKSVITGENSRCYHDYERGIVWIVNPATSRWKIGRKEPSIIRWNYRADAEGGKYKILPLHGLEKRKRFRPLLVRAFPNPHGTTVSVVGRNGKEWGVLEIDVPDDSNGAFCPWRYFLKGQDTRLETETFGPVGINTPKEVREAQVAQEQAAAGESAGQQQS